VSLQCAVPFAVHPPDSHLPDPHGDLAGLLLDGHLRRLARLRNPIEWRIARVLERLESGAGYLELGFARLSDYARERLGLPPRRVQTLVGLARRLAPLPRVAAAFEFGVLSQSQAALVARVATPLDEAPWVARAAARTVRRLSDEVREAVAGMTAMAAMAAPERQAAVVDENAAALCETDEPGQIVGFTAPARLRPLWDEALELARRSSGASDPVHQCVEFIAADFLSGAPDLPRLLAEWFDLRRSAAAAKAGAPRPTRTDMRRWSAATRNRTARTSSRKSSGPAKRNPAGARESPRMMLRPSRFRMPRSIGRMTRRAGSTNGSAP
jgi:hypothetical protein